MAQTPLRQVRWKEWKRVRTRRRKLRALGISETNARQWATSRKGYWRIAGSEVLAVALPNGYWPTSACRDSSTPGRRMGRGELNQTFTTLIAEVGLDPAAGSGPDDSLVLSAQVRRAAAMARVVGCGHGHEDSQRLLALSTRGILPSGRAGALRLVREAASLWACRIVPTERFLERWVAEERSRGRVRAWA